MFLYHKLYDKIVITVVIEYHKIILKIQFYTPTVNIDTNSSNTDSTFLDYNTFYYKILNDVYMYICI